MRVSVGVLVAVGVVVRVEGPPMLLVEHSGQANVHSNAKQGDIEHELSIHNLWLTGKPAIGSEISAVQQNSSDYPERHDGEQGAENFGADKAIGILLARSSFRHNGSDQCNRKPRDICEQMRRIRQDRQRV